MTRRALLAGLLVAPVAVPAALRAVAASPWAIVKARTATLTPGFQIIDFTFFDRLAGTRERLMVQLSRARALKYKGHALFAEDAETAWRRARGWAKGLNEYDYGSSAISRWLARRRA